MKTLKRLLTLLLITTLAVGAWAERVSQEDAATVANNFMNASTSASGVRKAVGDKRMVLKKAAKAEENQFYVYENADGEGWVMVAANDIAHPVIAYSDEGQFRFDNQPANVKCWLGKYNKQIKQAEADSVQATEEVQQEWRQLRKGVGIKKGTPVVAALIKTKWDQDDPYWNLCPMKGSKHDCYTGCVATAMAQVMYYWKWPKQGTGSYSYNTGTLGLACSADFANTTYDWDNMLLKYKQYYNEGSSTPISISSGTTAQQDAVATLMYHCGVAAAMDYNVASAGGSGAYTIYPNRTSTSTRCAQYALVNNFGYKSTIKGYYRPGGYNYSAVSDANWHNYLKTELDAKRPVMYAGADNEGGHSFVCDGYDNTTPTRKYHFNWGWSGYCDGYYDVDALVPGTGGSGSGNGSYNDDQDIIIGIEPPEVGHIIKLNGTGCTLSSDKQRVENGNSVTVTITPTDATYDYTSVTVKLGSTTISSSNYTLSANKQTLTINGSAITGDSSNDLTITVVWTKNRYKYELLGENCTVPADGMLAKNAALNLTITPDAGYTLANAECWDVTMGGSTLTYGTGFTYNSSTGAFVIASVTGDVEILAYGGRQVSWYANGSLHATNMSIDNKITLPSNPADCAGAGGKKFVGWCTDGSYSHATTAPTFAKDGDPYSVATYYAVYATLVASSAPRRAKMAESSATYTFTSKSWEATEGDWTSGQDGAGYSNSGVQVTTGASGANATCPTSYSNISSIVVSYCTNSSKGAGTIKMTVDGNDVSQSVSTSGGTTARDLTFDFSGTKPSGAPKITVTCTTNSIYVCGLTINYGGGGSSYIDYSTTCTTCTNTPIMSFTPATVDKTTADGSFTKAVSISNKGSGQTVAYSSSDETVATVNNSGVVTLNGIVGSATITASVLASGDYCAASASYTLNVTAAPIDVTLYYNGTSASLTNQTNPYTLPTGSPYNTAMCSGDWTFAGWYGSAYTKSTDAPAYITQLTATGSAYAVYTTTESSGSGGTGGSVSITTSTDNIPTGYGSANTFTEYTFEGYKFKVQQMYLNSGKLQWRAAGNSSGTGTMYNNETFPGKITSIVLTYNSSDANKNFTVKVGDSANPSSGTDITPSISGSVYTFDCSSENADYFVLTNGSGAGYLNQIDINYGGGGSSTTYYATSPDCVTPCSITPTMSFTNETVNKTTAETSYTQTVTIDNKGSGQTVAYSSSDETVATVNSSGVVTLNGIVGSTTITASVLADGDYCAASASYTINVTAAPIDVTLYYNGTSASLTNQTNPYTIPTGSPYNTAMCSGDWTFAGWYGSAYTKSTDAPAYITQLTATGSAYAVYTTTESSGGGSGSTVTLDATTDTSFPKDGITLTTSNGDLATGTDYRIYKGATLTITSSVGDISSIEFTFSGSYNGGGWATSYTPNSSTWTSPACTSGNSGKQARITQIVVTIGSGGGGSSTTYYATSPDCVTPCSNTPIMSFTNETVNQTTSDASYTQAVNISGKGSGQTVAYSSSDETVATVNSSGVVTLNGIVGSTTITASVLADGDYCAASASYTINVTAAPIDVTLYYNGTSASLTNQTNPYTIPTGSPYNTAMCSGDWTFAGWYGSAYTKSTDAPAYITQLTATGSAYAVYTTTESSGGGSGSTVTLDATTDTTFPKDGITLTTSNGVLNNGTDYRIYKGATLTITSSVGDISSIAFTFEGTYNGGGWETSYTPNSSSWTSPACTSGNSGKQAHITQIVVTIGSGGGSSTTYYATSPDCTPTTTYTVTWKSCGEVFDSKSYSEGAALVLPSSTPGANAGKSFVGWTATQHHTGADAPADLFTTAGSKTVTGDVTYYAVFH